MLFTFRPDTIDEQIAASVWRYGEYPVPPRFEPGDVVIDVGAHIGTFAALCLARGAGRVVACEADMENADRCAQHLAEHIPDRVAVLHAAVWRSDVPMQQLHHRGYGVERGLINTGSGDVFADAGPLVTTIGLDTLIGPAPEIRLLKLDCEGSEFAILATSEKLRAVREIVAEVHEYGGPYDRLIPRIVVPGIDHWTIPALVRLLVAHGFKVHAGRSLDIDGQPTRYGKLRAVRKD